MIYVQGGSAALDPGILETIIPFGVSGTWTAPFSGYAVFLVIGGGGSGAACSADNAAGVVAKGTGGGAGGFSMRRVLVTQGQVFTITIGAGGASVTATGANAQGLNGGLSSVVASGVNIIANGGSGGVAATGAAATPAGGAGGTATGGDVNYTGGAGGAISNVQGSGGAFGAAFATGGGAINVYNVISRGGNLADGGLPALANNTHASGGAGINGNGVDISTYPSNQGNGIGGGSAGGSNLILPASTLTVFGISFQALLAITSLIGSNGRGDASQSAGTSLSGSGGSAKTNGAVAQSGAVTIGSGSGAAAIATTVGAAAATSGAGGQGFVAVRLTRNA